MSSARTPTPLAADAQAPLRRATEAVEAWCTSELINNPRHGWLSRVPPTQVLLPLSGPPTPDDLDDLLAKAGRTPTFFLTHPLVIAAFERECARTGVRPAPTVLFDARVLTWRDTPLIPCDTLSLVDGKGKVLLLCAGDGRPAPPVRACGNQRRAIATYLIVLHQALAGHAPDALAVLEDVEIGRSHAYPDTYKGWTMDHGPAPRRAATTQEGTTPCSHCP
ncbi:hypothetical protein [Hydrogenophaga borbori]|nr:hypothetical protein [Hydrogenophaga borbori]